MCERVSCVAACLVAVSPVSKVDLSGKELAATARYCIRQARPCGSCATLVATRPATTPAILRLVGIGGHLGLKPTTTGQVGRTSGPPHKTYSSSRVT